jgi:hypothetical protein
MAGSLPPPTFSEHLANLFEKSNGELNEQEQTQLRELLCEFEDVFAKSEFDLRKFNAIQHGIDTGSNRPVKKRIRRTPLGFSGKEAQLKKMLGAGVIRPSILANSNNPYLVMNAVLEQSAGLIFTCQYAELASSLEYHTFPAKVSRHSSTKGNGNTSLVGKKNNLIQSFCHIT